METVRNQIDFPDTHDFIYNRKPFPFKFIYFLYSSKYFLENQVVLQNQKQIQLIEPELDYNLDIKDEDIQQFIKFVQLEDINITNENVHQLDYLATKYEVSKLSQYTSKYIKDHFNDVVLEYIITYQNSGYSLVKYEEIVSNDLFKYIEDEKMLKINISILYKIIENYYKKNQQSTNNIQINEEEEKEKENKILQLILNCIDKQGSMASILFNLVRYKFIGIDYINKLISEPYKDKIQYHFLNSQLAEFLNEKMILIEQMKASLVSKKEYENLESKNQKYKDDLILLNELEKIITIDNFNLLPLTLQKRIISNLIDKKNVFDNLEIFEKINNLLNYLLSFQNLDNENCFKIDTNDNQKQLLNIDSNCSIVILHNATETLYQNNPPKLNDFTKQYKQFSNFYVEIKYPSEFFDRYYQKICSQSFSIGILITENIKSSNISAQADYIKFDPDVTSIEGDYSNENSISKKGPFSNCTYLKKVEFPPALTIIGDFVFSKCSSITEIIIPSSVTYIGFNSFMGCSSLKSIIIPQSVTSVESYAFSECTSLTNVAILSELESIEPYVFNKCSSLKQVTIPSTIKFIKSNAFNGCSSLRIIDIPTNVESIGQNAFNDCSSLTFIEIPQSITSIEKHSFSGCSSLRYINIPPNVTIIESYAFSNCSSLLQIEIPSSIITIESNAFSDCSSLIKVEILSELESIEDYVFKNCSSIKNITIPPSVTSIKSNAFNGCSSLISISIPSLVESIESNTFSGCSSLEQITLPSTINYIGECAFYDCKALKSISFPPSITSIEPYTFCGCTSLENIDIPSLIENIGDRAFRGCESLKLISIPSSVISIDYYAFDDCSSLKQITLPSSLAKELELSLKQINPDIEIKEI